jgi:hypothetical protein
MTSPHLILAVSISGLIVAFFFVVKMAFDQRGSAFPNELPERPLKLSLLQRLSQKTSSAPSTSFTDDANSPHVLTRYTSITSKSTAHTPTLSERHPTSLRSTFLSRVSRSSNAKDTRSFLPQESVPVRELHDTSQSSPYTYRKPLSSNSQLNLKDPLVERSERLKLPWNGKLQPGSVVTAVLPPLSPSNTTTSSKPAQSRLPSFRAAKHIWKKMTGSKAIESKSSAISSAHVFPGDFGAQPQTTIGAGSKAQRPIIIDDSDHEGDLDSAATRYRKSSRRRVRADDRMPALPRQRTTPVTHQPSRRSRSPAMSDSSSGNENNFTPTSSEDVLYPNLSVDVARLQAEQPEPGEVRGPRSTEASMLQEELDRQFAERLERDEMDEYRRTQGLYAQQTTASGQPYTPSTTRGKRHSTQQRVRPTPASHLGTRDDPIDLDSESSSDSGESDRTVLGVRTGVEEDGMDPMDVDEEGWNSHDQDDAIDTSVDAMLARQLQEEDEHDAIDTSMDAMLAQQLQEEDEQSRRVVVATRACVVCDDTCPVADLPSLASCDHLPQTCASCYSGWVVSQLEGSSWREAKCPEDQCRIKMTYHEIQQIATPEIFQQYDTFIARAAISEDCKFHHLFLSPKDKLIDDNSQLPMVPSMRWRPDSPER